MRDEKRSVGLVLLAALAAVTLSLASPSSANAQITDDEAKYLKEKDEGPSQIFLVAPRVRGAWVPGFVWDLFLDRHGENWNGNANMSYGAEFILRTPKSHDLVFSLAWTDLQMTDAWWLGKGDPARKADWTEFDVSLLTLDASYYKWWEISEVFGIYAGGGIGLAMVIGDVTKHDSSDACYNDLAANDNPDRLDEAPCFVDGEPSLSGSTQKEDAIPPVIPLLNLTVGTQFTIEEHFFIRIDGGFKGYFFSGLSAGYTWW